MTPAARRERPRCKWDYGVARSISHHANSIFWLIHYPILPQSMFGGAVAVGLDLKTVKPALATIEARCATTASRDVEQDAAAALSGARDGLADSAVEGTFGYRMLRDSRVSEDVRVRRPCFNCSRPTRCPSPVYTTLSQLRSCKRPLHSTGSHAIELRSGNALRLPAVNQSIRNQYRASVLLLWAMRWRLDAVLGLPVWVVVGRLDLFPSRAHASVDTRHAHNEGGSVRCIWLGGYSARRNLLLCKPPLQPMSRCVRTLLRLERLLAPGPADS
jgi:hypothetical protein